MAMITQHASTYRELIRIERVPSLGLEKLLFVYRLNGEISFSRD
jgi:hypothetical protein